MSASWSAHYGLEQLSGLLLWTLAIAVSVKQEKPCCIGLEATKQIQIPIRGSQCQCHSEAVNIFSKNAMF